MALTEELTSRETGDQASQATSATGKLLWVTGGINRFLPVGRVSPGHLLASQPSSKRRARHCLIRLRAVYRVGLPGAAWEVDDDERRDPRADRNEAHGSTGLKHVSTQVRA